MTEKAQCAPLVHHMAEGIADLLLLHWPVENDAQIGQLENGKKSEREVKGDDEEAVGLESVLAVRKAGIGEDTRVINFAELLPHLQFDKAGAA